MDEGQQPERLSAQGHLVQLTESIWLSCRWLYGPLRILRGKNCWFNMHLRQRLINMLARILPRASLLRNNCWQRSNCFQVRSSEVQYQTNELFGIFLNRITNVVNLELGNDVEKDKMDSFLWCPFWFWSVFTRMVCVLLLKRLLVRNTASLKVKMFFFLYFWNRMFGVLQVHPS